MLQVCIVNLCSISVYCQFDFKNQTWPQNNVLCKLQPNKYLVLKERQLLAAKAHFVEAYQRMGASAAGTFINY